MFPVLIQDVDTVNLTMDHLVGEGLVSKPQDQGTTNTNASPSGNPRSRRKGIVINAT